MIGIIASIDNPTVEEVIDWLDKYGKTWKRIKGIEIFKCKKSFHLSNFNESSIDLDSFTSIWYRDFLDNRLLLREIINELKSSNENLNELYRIVVSEVSVLRKFLFSYLDNKILLPDFKTIQFSKLDQLRLAQKCGLNIPDFIITNDKNELLKFRQKRGAIITKPLFESSYFFQKKIALRFLTKEIKNKDIEQLPNLFFPSYFQEKIDKMYEIRTFVLNKSLYSMCIFSQNDNQTKIDFRNYNFNNPNRTVPFKLPTDIEKNIINLFDKLKINTGSVDLIRSVTGKFYFLEINPNGQFGMVSKPCNYYLERQIAKFLS